jgi:hypothetical protein
LEAEGKTLTRQQSRDIAWLKKQESDAAVASWIEAVPKGEYCLLAGRQHKLIDDAARQYDLPLGQATIDLAKALTAMHDLIASNANRLKSAIEGDRDELEEEKLRKQIEKLAIENEKLTIALERDKGLTISRAELREALTAVSAMLRERSRAFARMGADARKLWNDTMEDIATEIEQGRLKF